MASEAGERSRVVGTWVKMNAQSTATKTASRSPHGAVRKWNR